MYDKNPDRHYPCNPDIDSARSAAAALERRAPKPMKALAGDALRTIAQKHEIPGYRLDDVRIGIVHLGVGNFHRAHQAPCFDAALAAGDLRWGVAGVSLQRAVLRDALAPQQGLYALDTGEARLRVIGCLRETLVATDPGAGEAIVTRMADPGVHWWTLTITEKGYGLDPGDVLMQARLQADLKADTAPVTAIGQLFAALARRFGERAEVERGDGLPRADAIGAAARKLTIASCDNLSRNGRSLQRALLSFAAAARAEPAWRARAGRVAGNGGPIAAIDLLTELIAERIAFPDSMVDRIVPATTDELRERVANRLGYLDAWPVATEPFTQWVIEDCVRGERPALEDSGVQWVDDVAPHEALKLRLLNAAHSVLAYGGLLAGHATVDQAFADPLIGGFVEAFWRDTAIAALPPAARGAAHSYCARLRTRFSNPTIGHALAQIAIDGSLKIPLRWLGPQREIAAPGHSIEAALACWIRWLSTTTPERIGDPQALALHAAACNPDPARAVAGVLEILDASGPQSRIDRIVDALREPGHPLIGFVGR